jgi:hypothetical protein
MRTHASFISKQTGVTSSPGSPSICGSRRSSTYWAMSIQQRRASFVRRKQTGRQTKKLVDPRSTNRWHSVAVAALGSVAVSWKECAAQCNPRRDHSREVPENGKVPHANQEPSRMGNGRQVRNAGAGGRRPPRARTLCGMPGSRWRKDARISIFLK